MSDVVKFIAQIYADWGIAGLFALSGWGVAVAVYFVMRGHSAALRDTLKDREVHIDVRTKLWADEQQRWREAIAHNDQATQTVINDMTRSLQLLSERTSTMQTLMLQTITLIKR